ncbi:MAG: bifunctional phosphopantothenoylcysteine decarboxylase/phosphopantothenate--cysteine ligase CoaBC [Brevinematales bacterium]|nr:bifunctional phosphopantothenoylcysteine decarboxylase/phosphopantothenate--cysteine ligase CoaBC [Brevinematales bacterium]
MNIVFGITSGISIYKIPSVIRKLRKDGHNIRVLMTPNAKKLMNPIIFKVASGNEVYINDFSIHNPLLHIEIGDWSDVFVIAPLTANTLAKIANGIADNLLTTSFLACSGKKIVFPAMNVKMYDSQITQENIKKLKEYGVLVIEPDCGDLACGYSGKGRLPSEDKIIGIITRDIYEPLKGKRFIVTAGSTIEKIDPVRFITNFSSGKMGIEIAKYLYKKGADVLLIVGKTEVNIPEYITHIKVESTIDMLNAIKNNLKDYDGLYMVAAPVDFRVNNYSEEKIKRKGSLTIELIENPDILKSLRKDFKEKFFVGFALESKNGKQNASLKLKEKELDYIVLNIIEPDFNPMGNEENRIFLFEKSGSNALEFKGKKHKVAEWIVNKTLKLEEV